MRILLLLCFVGVVVGSGLGSIRGALVFLQTPTGEVTSEAVQIKNNFKKYITEELNNSIGHDYDSIFVGLLVRFTDLDTLYRHISQLLAGGSLGSKSEKEVFAEFSNLLYEHQKANLKRARVELIVEPDLEVSVRGT